MVFSKSLGYAVRGLLYVAIAGNGRKIQLAEIADKLNVPRHFLAKVMKNLVKENLLHSMKGPYGGFYLTKKTKEVSLAHLMEITGEDEKLKTCVLKLKKCNADAPCPMHHQVQELRVQWKRLLQETTLNDLLTGQEGEFLQHITLS